MAHFLITGGCGFIGSHLADGLLGAGHKVRILDDLSSGKRDNAPAAAELVLGSVNDRALVADCIKGVDGIFHLAAIASVHRTHEDWLGCHAVNLTGCLNVFDATRSRPSVRVVYASSAAVYGAAASMPLTEADTPRPLSAYGADKLGCELHARVATALHHVPTVGLRFFNVYGPRQDATSPYAGVISVFADHLRRKQPVDVCGDGHQVRDFIFVADVVQFLMAAMATRDIAGKIFNVCTGQGTSILELAHLIGKLCHVAPRIQFKPPRQGDIRSSVGDPTLANRSLGCTARHSLREGLIEMLEIDHDVFAHSA